MIPVPLVWRWRIFLVREYNLWRIYLFFVGFFFFCFWWCFWFVRWQWGEQMHLGKKRCQYRQGKVPPQLSHWLVSRWRGLEDKQKKENSLFWRRTEICVYTDNRVFYKLTERIRELEETEEERGDEKREKKKEKWEEVIY